MMAFASFPINSSNTTVLLMGSACKILTLGLVSDFVFFMFSVVHGFTVQLKHLSTSSFLSLVKIMMGDSAQYAIVAYLQLKVAANRDTEFHSYFLFGSDKLQIFM